jgi:hypothetical protein
MTQSSRFRFHRSNSYMTALTAARTLAFAVAMVPVLACGSRPAGAAGQTASGAARGSSPAAQTSRASQTGAGQITVRTTTPPKNDCDWIPVSDVEAIVGKLAGPPTEYGGCRYTLVMPDQIRALRENELRGYEADAGKNEMAAFLAKKTKPIADPKNYAMTLSVEWSGATDMMHITKEVIANMFAADGDTPAGRTSDRAKPPNGWDDEGGVPFGYSGRIGHIRITVLGETPDVPTQPMAVLAAKVRDRIPDLPFPVKNRYQVMMDVPANADPCGLVTRAEAEAVLGPLVVDPYRSSSYFPPLVHPSGHACAYFTAGHHVFVLTPIWTKGARNFALDKGLGGLVRQVMPQQEDVILKGPWDKSQITMDGNLAFLKGDRLLEVNFLMSSTKRIGALKLATLAMQRLSAMTFNVEEPRDVPRALPPGGTAPAWSRTVKLSDGRTMVADAALVLDASLAKPAALPTAQANAGAIERSLAADLPFDLPLTALPRGQRPRTYLGLGGMTFNADYIDYLLRTLPADRARIRMAAGHPAVILLDRKPVGLLMPLA